MSGAESMALIVGGYDSSSSASGNSSSGSCCCSGAKISFVEDIVVRMVVQAVMINPCTKLALKEKRSEILIPSLKYLRRTGLVIGPTYRCSAYLSLALHRTLSKVETTGYLSPVIAWGGPVRR
jgi:hypothetical protein